MLLLPGHFLTALFQLTLIGSDVTISRLGDDKKGWPAINVVVESWPTAYFYMCGWSWKNPTRRLVVGQRSFLINICFSFFYLFRRSWTSFCQCVCLVWEGNDGPMSLDFRVAVKSFFKRRKKNWFECWHHSPLPGLRLLDTLFNLADVYAVLRSLLVSTFEPVKAISIWPLLFQSKQSRKRKPPLGLWHKGTGYCPIPQRCHLGWKDDTAIFVDQTTISRVERKVTTSRSLWQSEEFSAPPLVYWLRVSSWKSPEKKKEKKFLLLAYGYCATTVCFMLHCHFLSNE